MPVFPRSQASVGQSLAHAASSRATPSPPGFLSASSSEIPQQPFLEGGVNCGDRAFGGRPSTLAVGKKNERPTAVRNYFFIIIIIITIIIINIIIINFF